jgi:hypothetical protein
VTTRNFDTRRKDALFSTGNVRAKILLEALPRLALLCKVFLKLLRFFLVRSLIPVAAAGFSKTPFEPRFVRQQRENSLNPPLKWAGGKRWLPPHLPPL